MSYLNLDLPNNKGLKKTDITLYAVSIVLGAAIVLSNYYVSAPENTSASQLDSYMQKVLNRMDNVSGQLSAWGSIDLSQDRY